ncbi:GTP-binding protein At2g22870 [Lotus japonicus]|uniref:GTP-binding protein At2g22870 n=1 Tax=Lotus japonicus TaxID=34305 RepID=UPI00258BEAE2|nr:GTP-binding protein At2g22870 [Lotus japonicus]
MTVVLRRGAVALTFLIPSRSSFSSSSSSLSIPKSTTTTLSLLSFRRNHSTPAAASKTSSSPSSLPLSVEPRFLFIPPGIEPDEVTDSMILPASNIVVGPYAGDSRIKDVEFVKSSPRARDCPKDDRPEFAVLGRSNVGKSSLINSLVRKKELALTSKRPGKTQLINHFLVNKSWYLVDLPGYGFAKASEAAKTDWASFTKGYFLNRNTLVAVLLLIDASVPPQRIDLDCANWLGRNNIPVTFVFTKCDKMKVAKGKRPDENIKEFQEIIKQNFKQHPPWIMTSSVTGLGRDDLLLHVSQLRNYWDQ